MGEDSRVMPSSLELEQDESRAMANRLDEVACSNSLTSKEEAQDSGSSNSDARIFFREMLLFRVDRVVAVDEEVS